MMTIHDMCWDLKRRGFTVSIQHNYDESHTVIVSILFTIEKAGVIVGKVYDAQHSGKAEDQHQYQLSFLRELVSKWNKKFDQRIDEARVACNEAGKNFDKMILNSIYGAPKPYKEIYISTSRPLSHLEIEKMAKANIAITKEPWPKMNPYTNKSTNNPKIKDVIFNDPATIIFWSDGTKTVVKCQEDDIYDPEKGLAMAITKKFFGNKGNYCNEIKKWMDKYIEKIGEEINPFQIAWDKACETVKQAKNSVPSTDDISKTSPADG